jgi:hypothetical protein
MYTRPDLLYICDDKMCNTEFGRSIALKAFSPIASPLQGGDPGAPTLPPEANSSYPAVAAAAPSLDGRSGQR